MKLIPGKVYTVRPIRLKGQKPDERAEKRDRCYIYERSTSHVAVFRHISGKYRETWQLLDIQDGRVRIEEQEERRGDDPRHQLRKVPK